MNDSFKKDLTDGNVNKLLLEFSLPFLFAQILQALYSLVDMFIVGIFMGDKGISAISNSSIMTMFITALVSGFALSGTVLVAQYVGSKDDENALKSVKTIFTLFLYVGIIITIIGLLLTNKLLEFLHTPVEAYEEAKSYLKICFLGTVFICGYNVISAVLRGLGDSKRPLYFVLAATIINIFLDLFFVGYLKMGAGGAALATIMSQGLSFIFAVITLYKSNFMFDFKPKSFVIDKEKLPVILKIGLPSAVQSTIVNFSFLFVISQINAYGLAASTAAGIGAKLDSIAILPTASLSQAVASMAGQNLGAKRYDRARATMFSGIRISMTFGIIVFILVRVFSKEIMEFFGCGPESVEIGILYIKLVSFSYILNSVVFIINGLANGSGNSFFAMINATINMIFARIPLIFLFTAVFHMGLNGIFLAMGTSQIFGLISAIIFYLSGRWKRSVIEKPVKL